MNLSDLKSDMDHLTKQFLLDVTPDGAVFVRERDTGPSLYGGLPVFSTDTAEQARALIVRHCKLARNGSGIYRLNNFSGSVDELWEVTALFATTDLRDVPP